MSGAQDTQQNSAGDIPRPRPTASLRETLATHAASSGIEPSDAEERILDQEEIDSILGPPYGRDSVEATSGLDRILGSGVMPYERLPMLEVVFDRLTRTVSTSLRGFLNDNVDVSMDGIHSMRFGDYLNNTPSSCLLAVFEAEEWENFGLMMVDAALIYSVVDSLLGGNRGAVPVNVEGRMSTPIERALIDKLVRLLLTNLSAEFNPICAVNFRLDRIEAETRFATISRASNAVFLARMRVDMGSRGGNIDIVLPYATLEPVRDLLLQQFMGEKLGHDPAWGTSLADNLLDADIEIQAILDEQEMMFSDLVDLKPGARIVLDHQIGEHVRLKCGDAVLFEGRLGRKKDKIAIKIEKELPRSRNFVEESNVFYS